MNYFEFLWIHNISSELLWIPKNSIEFPGSPGGLPSEERATLVVARRRQALDEGMIQRNSIEVYKIHMKFLIISMKFIEFQINHANSYEFLIILNTCREYCYINPHPRCSSQSVKNGRFQGACWWPKMGANRQKWVPNRRDHFPLRRRDPN